MIPLSLGFIVEQLLPVQGTWSVHKKFSVVNVGSVFTEAQPGSTLTTLCFQTAYSLKSVHFKKTVAWISFLSKLWYFQYKSKQFWKERDSCCLLKINGLYWEKSYKYSNQSKNNCGAFQILILMNFHDPLKLSVIFNDLHSLQIHLCQQNSCL